MAQTEEESRRLAEELINATNALSQFSGMLYGQSAEQLKATQADKDAKEAASKFAAKMDAASEAAKALAGVFVNYQKEVYKGSSANKAAAASIDAMGEAAKYAGVFLALLVPGGPLVKGLVAGIGLLTSELIKSGKLIAEQTDEIYKAYQDMAKAGAAGAGGMQDVFDSLQKVGMGTEKFGAYIKLVNENASDLAMFGGSVNKGRKIFENTMSSLSKDQRVQMEQMGLDREAQSQAAMAYIKQQRLLTAGTKAQMDTSSTAVMKYVAETDALTRITGANREEQQKILDEAMAEDIFGSFLDNMRSQGEEGVKKAEQIQNAIIMQQKMYGTQSAKGLRDSLTGFLGTSSENQKFFMSYGEGGQQLVNTLRDVNGTNDDMYDAMKAQAKSGKELNESMAGITGMGVAGDVFIAYKERRLAEQNFNKDLGKLFAEAAKERADMLKDPTTKKAAEAENNVRETQLKQQRLVNLGMDTYISTSHTASEANLALAEAALAAAKWLGKMTGDAERKKTQTLAQAKQTHGATTQTALEAADKARATAADANATKEQKAAAQKAADLAAAESQQTAREQREAQLRETNERRKKQKAERAAALMKPSAAAPASGSAGGAAPAAGGGGAASSSAPAPQGMTGPEPHAAVGSGGGKEEKPKLTRISSKSGPSTSVNEKYAPRFQGLVDWLDGQGYAINSLGGYVDRDVRGQPGVKSVHAHGAAIDINPSANPFGSKLVTDMPANVASVAKQMGLGWGGNWTSVKDAMHFSVAKNEGGDIQLADGGIVPARPGGTRAVIGEGGQDEAVIPLKDGKLPVHINSKDIDSLGGGYNELKGYTMGPMSTDLAILEKIAGKLGAYDKSTQMITDPKLWKEIVQSGMLMNYDLGQAKIGTRGMSEMVGSDTVADALAGRIKELIDTKKDSSEAIAQTRTEFADMMKTFYEDFFAKMIAQQQTENPLDAEMLATLKEISRTNAAAAGASEKMLRYTQN
jgi:hypothetical protein